MESGFGLVQLWQQGETITRSVGVLLLFMSLATWTVIAVKAIGVLRIKRLQATPRQGKLILTK